MKIKKIMISSMISMILAVSNVYAAGFGDRFTLGFLSCKSDTTGLSILLITFSVIMILFSLMLYKSERRIYELLGGFIIIMFGLTISNCFFLVNILYFLLGAGNIIHSGQ